MPQPALTPHEASERLRGIIYACIAPMFFTMLDASAKFAGAYVSAIEIAWARYALSLVFAAIILQPWRHLSEYVTHRPFVQILRAAFLLGSTVLNFFALQYLQLAETISIVFAMPLIVTALAGPVLGEHVGPRRWAAVVVGFIGVLVVVNPQPSTFQPAALLSLASASCYAGYALTTRMLTHTESASGLLIYASLFATLVLTPALPFQASLPPTWLVVLALAVTGIAGAAGHWFLIRANRHAPATVLAPFNYTQLVWMVLAGYLLFGDVPGPNTIVGAAIIVASGLYILYREQVRRDR